MAVWQPDIDKVESHLRRQPDIYILETSLKTVETQRFRTMHRKKMYANVPVIDISPLLKGVDMEAMKETTNQIEKACKDSGFFLVSNHGVEVLEELCQVTTKFHQSMTEEEKNQIAIVAYNKENEKQIRNGYYLSIPGKKAVESYVCIYLTVVIIMLTPK